MGRRGSHGIPPVSENTKNRGFLERNEVSSETFPSVTHRGGIILGMRKSFILSILGFFLILWLVVVGYLYLNGTEDVFGNRAYGLEAVLAWIWAYLFAVVGIASIFVIAISVAEKLGKKETNQTIVKRMKRIGIIIIFIFTIWLAIQTGGQAIFH